MQTLFTTKDKLAESRTAQAKSIFEGLQRETIDRSLFTSNANFYFSDQAVTHRGDSNSAFRDKEMTFTHRAEWSKYMKGTG